MIHEEAIQAQKNKVTIHQANVREDVRGARDVDVRHNPGELMKAIKLEVFA